LAPWREKIFLDWPEGVRRAPKKVYPSLGLGEDVRVQGLRSFPGQPWSMREGFCTFRPLATQGKGKVGQKFLFNAFPKGEKGVDILFE